VAGAGEDGGLVPVYTADQRLLAWWPAALAARNGNLRIVRSRRGHIKRAYLRDDAPVIVQRLLAERRRSSYGAAFVQKLDSGRPLWALRGVRGSR